FLVRGTNWNVCHTHFANLRILSPDYLDFGLIESNGTMFCSAFATRDKLCFADRSYFQRVLQTKRFSIGEFQEGTLTNKPSIDFGYPILDEKGELQKVLYASLNLALLSQVAAQPKLPSQAAVTVIDRSGNILARHPHPDKWVGRALPSDALIKTILSGIEGTFEMAGIDGASHLHAATAIPGGGDGSLFVSIGIPKDIPFASANRMLFRNLGVLMLVGTLSLLLARTFANAFVLRPIHTMIGA